MRWALGALGALVLIVGAYAAIRALSLGSSWASVDRIALDTAPSETTPTTQTSRAPLERTIPELAAGGRPTSTEPTTTPSSSTIDTTTTTPTSTTLPGRQLLEEADSAPSVMALIGSDSRAGLEESGDFGDFPGRRADVIVLAIREGEQVSLLSVPRDLYVTDSCRGGRHRIGEALEGCGDIGGFSLIVRELEDLTGLDIQHLAAVDLAGFKDFVDALGGYEICTDYPVRDRKSGLSLDAGCTMADGETTLQWLRSRYTERFVEGTWERVPEVSDLTRNTRQRQFLMDVFERVIERDDPRAILDVVENVAPHLTIDDELTLADAASWLWDYRTSDVGTAEIPVDYRRTERGASVLVPAVDVEEFASDIPS